MIVIPLLKEICKADIRNPAGCVQIDGCKKFAVLKAFQRIRKGRFFIRIKSDEKHAGKVLEKYPTVTLVCSSFVATIGASAGSEV
ncbi:MAG: hypothetical protein ACLTTO_10370 [Lachnospiraceae bacterium]